jgi:hypothetical protein
MAGRPKASALALWRAGKIIFLLALLAFVCGCISHQYKVTLRNEQVIPARTRPKLDKKTATYTFKDLYGRRLVIPAHQIREIEIR